MKHYFPLMIILLLITSCSSLRSSEKYTPLQEAKTFKFLTISGQPNKKTIDDIKEQNFNIVLNLRNPGEFSDFNEEKYVTSKGLEYYNLPFFNKNEEITIQNIQAITDFVEKNRDKKIFLHCSSGNRASAWLFIHLNRDHNVSLNEATKITLETGLQKELRKSVLTFLEKSK